MIRLDLGALVWFSYLLCDVDIPGDVERMLRLHSPSSGQVSIFTFVE